MSTADTSGADKAQELEARLITQLTAALGWEIDRRFVIDPRKMTPRGQRL
jgi:hypothetical protein